MNDTDLAAARTFHSRLVDLLRVEFASLGAFLEALAEFDRRKLFRDLGHANLFAYLHKGLRLSRGAAHYRCAAAWLVQRFPEVLEPIRDGRFCFTTVAVLASVVTEENLAAVLPRFYGLSKQEALELAAELKPRTVVPTRTVVTRVEPVAVGRWSGSWTGGGSPGRGDRTDGSSPRRTLGVPDDRRADDRHGEPDARHGVEGVPGSPEEGEGGSVPRAARSERRGGTHGRAGVAHREAGEAEGLCAGEGEAGGREEGPGGMPVESRGRWGLRGDGAAGDRPRGSAGEGRNVDGGELRILCRAHNIEAARQVYGDAHMDLFTRGGSPGGGPLAREDTAAYEAGPRPPRLCRSQSGFGASSDWCAPGGEGPWKAIVGKSD